MTRCSFAAKNGFDNYIFKFDVPSPFHHEEGHAETGNMQHKRGHEEETDSHAEAGDHAAEQEHAEEDEHAASNHEEASDHEEPEISGH